MSISFLYIIDYINTCTYPLHLMFKILNLRQDHLPRLNSPLHYKVCINNFTNSVTSALNSFKTEVTRVIKNMFSPDFASNVIKVLSDKVIEKCGYINYDNLYPDLLCPILDECLATSITVSNLKTLLTGLDKKWILYVAAHPSVQQQNITLETLLCALGLDSENLYSSSPISRKRSAQDDDSYTDYEGEYQAKRYYVFPDTLSDSGEENSPFMGDDNNLTS